MSCERAGVAAESRRRGRGSRGRQEEEEEDDDEAGAVRLNRTAHQQLAAAVGETATAVGET
jgi:hypothetical protein